MKKVTKEELRGIQCAMAAYIDGICREKDIEYSLAAGSLLGTVKYKGYIPWDDDIDLMLTRPNYEKLLSVLMEDLPENYSLLYYKVCKTYLPMAKLYDNRTAFTSKLDTLNVGTGVFIDIFPIDDLPDNKVEGEKFKKKIRKEVTHLTASHKGLSYASAEKPFYFIAKSVLWLPSHLRYFGKTQELAKRVDHLMQQYNHMGNNYCNYVFSPPKKTAYFEKKLFNEYEDSDFENLTLRKLKKHESYLAELYGEWQQPPHKNKQRSHDYYHWYWKE